MLITLKGVQINCVQRGQGPDILLLHGWGCHVGLWEHLMGALSSRARVTALDFPGHGESGPPPEPWGVTDFTQLALALMDELGIAKCDIVAHSFGGRVAMLLATAYPERVGKMVFTGAAGIRPQPSAVSARRSAKYRRLRGLWDKVAKLPGLAQVAARQREVLVQRYGSVDYKALDAQMRQTFSKVVEQDLRAYLPRIQAPTLLYWGDKDDQTPLWMAYEMERTMQDAGLAIVPGAGHFAYLEHALNFARVVSYFLLEEG